MTQPSSVHILAQGGAARVRYAEGAHAHEFQSEELAADPAYVVLHVPAPEEWARALPWAAGRRAEVLERVARELCRQRYPRGRVTIGSRTVEIRE